MSENRVAIPLLLSASVALVLAMATYASGGLDSRLPNRGQPKRDFGGPMPIGVTMYKKPFIGSPEPVVMRDRVWVMPWDDYSDPVSLSLVDQGTDYSLSFVYSMPRADYENAKINCRSLKQCHAYMKEGDDGLRKYEEWRKSVNSDVNDNRYIFSDGLETFGDGVVQKKKSGQKIEYPSSIVWTSGDRPND